MTKATVQRAFSVAAMLSAAFSANGYGTNNAPPIQPPPTPDQPTIESGTFILSSADPRLDMDNGTALFTIDINHLGFGKKLRLIGAKRTALIFDKADTQQNRLCPFFNLDERSYKIKEEQKNIYVVITTVSEDEIARVNAAKCAVTTAPDLRKIEYLR